MDSKNLCPNCMRERTSEYGSCIFCGYDENTYVKPFNDLYPGTALGGRYIVGNSITSSTSDITYIGFDISLQIVVIIKEMFLSDCCKRYQGSYVYIENSEYSAFEINKQRFLREARAIAMSHNEDTDGMIQVRDCFEDNGTVYTVMEHLDGISLKERIETNGTLSFDQTLNLMIPICEALTSIHKNGLTHKGVSPSNIICLSDGRAKLLDFGNCINLDEDSPESHVKIRRDFVPVEQFLSYGSLGPWTDIYSVAATIYFCLAGKAPTDAVSQVSGQNIKSLSKLGVKIDRNAESVIYKALALNPENRFQSMEQFLASLREKSRIAKYIAGFSAAAAMFVFTMSGGLKDKILTNASDQMNTEYATAEALFTNTHSSSGGGSTMENGTVTAPVRDLEQVEPDEKGGTPTSYSFAETDGREDSKVASAAIELNKFNYTDSLSETRSNFAKFLNNSESNTELTDAGQSWINIQAERETPTVTSTTTMTTIDAIDSTGTPLEGSVDHLLAMLENTPTDSTGTSTSTTTSTSTSTTVTTSTYDENESANTNGSTVTETGSTQEAPGTSVNSTSNYSTTTTTTSSSTDSATETTEGGTPEHLDSQATSATSEVVTTSGENTTITGSGLENANIEVFSGDNSNVSVNTDPQQYQIPEAPVYTPEPAEPSAPQETGTYTEPQYNYDQYAQPTYEQGSDANYQDKAANEDPSNYINYNLPTGTAPSDETIVTPGGNVSIHYVNVSNEKSPEGN